VFDAAGIRQSSTFAPLQVLGGGPPLSPQFYTPIELNRVNAMRLIIGAANAIYESDDQGDTITAIAQGLRINDTGPIAYGALGNEDVLYAGVGRNVWVRTAAHPAALARSAAYPASGEVVGLAMVPDNPDEVFAIDALHVFRTTDAGAQWSDITHNLPTLGVTVLRSVAFCTRPGRGFVAVGTNSGVFAAPGPDYSSWTHLGAALPTVPVLRLHYDDRDHMLLAGTLGRGTWTLDLPQEAIA
jgi:hypothetical protein